MSYEEYKATYAVMEQIAKKFLGRPNDEMTWECLQEDLKAWANAHPLPYDYEVKVD